MQKTKSRALALFTALCMAMSLLPTVAFAEGEPTIVQSITMGEGDSAIDLEIASKTTGGSVEYHEVTGAVVDSLQNSVAVKLNFTAADGKNFATKFQYLCNTGNVPSATSDISNDVELTDGVAEISVTKDTPVIWVVASDNTDGSPAKEIFKIEVLEKTAKPATDASDLTLDENNTVAISLTNAYTAEGATVTVYDADGNEEKTAISNAELETADTSTVTLTFAKNLDAATSYKIAVQEDGKAISDPSDAIEINPYVAPADKTPGNLTVSVDGTTGAISVKEEAGAGNTVGYYVVAGTEEEGTPVAPKPAFTTDSTNTTVEATEGYTKVEADNDNNYKVTEADKGKYVVAVEYSSDSKVVKVGVSAAINVAGEPAKSEPKVTVTSDLKAGQATGTITLKSDVAFDDGITERAFTLNSGSTNVEFVTTGDIVTLSSDKLTATLNICSGDNADTKFLAGDVTIKIGAGAFNPEAEADVTVKTTVKPANALNDINVVVNNKGEISGDTATTEGTLVYYIIDAYTTEIEAKVAGWTTDTEAAQAATDLGVAAESVKPTLDKATHDGKVLVVVETKESKIVAVGHAAISFVSETVAPTLTLSSEDVKAGAKSGTITLTSDTAFTDAVKTEGSVALSGANAQLAEDADAIAIDVNNSKVVTLKVVAKDDTGFAAGELSVTVQLAAWGKEGSASVTAKFAVAEAQKPVDPSATAAPEFVETNVQADKTNKTVVFELSENEYPANVAVKLYTDAEGKTEATGVTAAFKAAVAASGSTPASNATLTLTFTTAITKDTTYHVTFKDGDKTATTPVAIKALVYAQTNTPATANAVVTAEDADTAKVVLNNKIDYSAEPVVKVYVGDATEASDIVTGAYANGTVTISGLSELDIPAAGVQLKITLTDGAKAESEPLTVTVKPYVRSSDATIKTIVVDGVTATAENNAYTVSVVKSAEEWDIGITTTDAKAVSVKYLAADPAGNADAWDTATAAEKVNGVFVIRNSAAPKLWLRVTAENNEATANYTLTVEKAIYDVEIADTTPVDGVAVDGDAGDAVKVAVAATTLNGSDPETVNSFATAIVNATEKAIAEKKITVGDDSTSGVWKEMDAAGIEVKVAPNIISVAYLKIDVTADGYDAAKGTYKLDITPVCVIYGTTATNPNDINPTGDDKNAIALTEEMPLEGVSGEVVISLPNAFNDGDTVYVKHTHDGKVTNTTAMVDESKNITLTVPGFSPFEISKEPTGKAIISETSVVYAEVQDAVNAVEDGQTIVLTSLVTADLTLKAPTSGVASFTIDKTTNSVTANITFEDVKAEDGFTYHAVIDGAGNVTVTRAKTEEPTTPVKPSTPSGGGGGGSSSTTSYVKSGKTENGSFSISNKNAKVGATVTITPKANEGYVVDKVTVTDKNGDTVKVTLNSDGTYSFEMPSTRPVTVNVTFKEADKTHPSVDTFRDVSANDWFVDAVDYVLANNLMTGTSSTTFEPEATTTRGMVVTILYRLEKEPEAGAADFGDVADGEWYSKAVAWAAENEIVNGYDNGNFGPNDDITREQLVAILYRYSQFKKYDVTAQGSLTGYTDANVINDYAQTAMSWANATGLVLGTSDTTLEPASNATRAQVATVLMRFCEDIAK